MAVSSAAPLPSGMLILASGREHQPSSTSYCQRSLILCVVCCCSSPHSCWAATSLSTSQPYRRPTSTARRRRPASFPIGHVMAGQHPARSLEYAGRISSGPSGYWKSGSADLLIFQASAGYSVVIRCSRHRYYCKAPSPSPRCLLAPRCSGTARSPMG